MGQYCCLALDAVSFSFVSSSYALPFLILVLFHSSLESEIGIIAACLATMRPLWSNIIGKFKHRKRATRSSRSFRTWGGTRYPGARPIRLEQTDGNKHLDIA